MSSIFNASELARIRDDLEAQIMLGTCNILSRTRTADNQGGWTETWGTASASVRCRLAPRTGREVMTGGAVQPFHSYILTLPHDTTITPANRVEIGTIAYTVTSVDAQKTNPFCLRVEVEKV